MRKGLLLGLALLLLGLTACGGTKNIGTLVNPVDSADRSSAGVTLGDFEVVRYNANGLVDPSLNDTLALRLENRDGETALVVRVDDSEFTTAVNLKIDYDSELIHPARAEFHGLMGDSGNVLSAAILDGAEYAGIGETVVRDYLPGTLSGDFATVYFAEGATRVASALHEGSVDAMILDTYPNLVADDTTVADQVTVTWSAGWHQADGDQNGEVNIADISPIGAEFSEIVAENWLAVIADYDGNGEVNISDLSPIGANFGDVTSGYEVLVDDDTADTPSGAAIAGGTLLWSEATNSTNNTTVGDVQGAFDFWQVVYGAATDVTFDAITALDVNDNQLVRVFVQPVFGEEQGTPAFVDVAVEEGGGGDPEVKNVTVNAFNIQVTNLDDDADHDDIFPGDHNSSSKVDAHETCNGTMLNVSGLVNGQAFDASMLPDSLPKSTLPVDDPAYWEFTAEDYEEIFTLMRNSAVWSVTSAGATGMRYVDPPISFSGAYSGTGDPGGIQVFWDDDSESSGTDSEGVLAVSLPQTAETTLSPILKVRVTNAISTTIRVDVEENSDALIIVGYETDNEDNKITIGLDTTVTVGIDLGDWNPGSITNLNDILVHTLWFDPDGGAPLNEPTVYTWNDPTDDPALTGGEFDIDDSHGDWVINLRTKGPQIVAGRHYAVRVFNGLAWSSVNKPAAMLETADPIPAEELLTIPPIIDFNIGYIQIFYEDPIIRRDPRVLTNGIAGTADPYDAEAYGDVLKQSGNEFTVNAIPPTEPNPGLYPLVEVVQTDNPNTINFGDGDPDAILVERKTGSLVVDVRVMAQGLTAAETWSYKVFGPGGDADVIGTGSFVAAPLVPGSVSLTGINYGINAFNRENIPMSARHYGTGTQFVNNETIALPVPHATQPGKFTYPGEPDVLWVEFNGGYMFNYKEYHDNDPDWRNVHLILEDNDTAEPEPLKLDLRVVGLSTAGNYLAIHPFVFDDYHDGSPGGDGIWPTATYIVHLNDGNIAGDFDFTFLRSVTDPRGDFTDDKYLTFWKALPTP